MTRKRLKFDNDAADSLSDGLELLAKSVATTLGPGGHTVLIKRNKHDIMATKDGVTVAQYVTSEDPFENCGIMMAREAASTSSKRVGDGTTTSTVLAHAIFKAGKKRVVAGANSIAIKRGIDKVASWVISELSSFADKKLDFDDLRAVARIACNYDEKIAELVAKAVLSVGEYGTISLEIGASDVDKIEVVDGAHFAAPFISNSFADKTFRWAHKNVLIAVVDKELSSAEDVIPLMEIAHDEKRPLLIIAQNFTGTALKAMLINHAQGNVKVCGVKALYYGRRQKDFIIDMCTLTGAALLAGDEARPIEKANFSDLGSAESVICTSEHTTIARPTGSKEKIIERLQTINNLIPTAVSSHEHRIITDRLACISGSIAKVILGGLLESEIEEKKARVEDAIHAARSATMNGIVPGGGTALLKLSMLLEEVELDLRGDEVLAQDIMIEALQAPFKQIVANIGDNAELLAGQLRSGRIWDGYDALNQKACDMSEAEIYDPTDVVVNEVRSATSVAGLMLTAGCIITIHPKDRES